MLLCKCTIILVERLREKGAGLASLSLLQPIRANSCWRCFITGTLRVTVSKVLPDHSSFHAKLSIGLFYLYYIGKIEPHATSFHIPLFPEPWPTLALQRSLPELMLNNIKMLECSVSGALGKLEDKLTYRISK